MLNLVNLSRTSIWIPIKDASKKIKEICNTDGSQSKFYPSDVPLSSGYKDCVSHYFQSSSKVAHSAVQPGTVSDLIEFVNILKTHRVPFAIKGDGHTSNANFSSTHGIQISMALFNKITYHNDSETLAVGAGCLFDEVYVNEGLKKASRNIVGGEDHQGVGVAGWLLGGGYSMKTNRFGLGIDNVEAYEVVVPGREGETARLEIVKRNDQEQDKKDLFWALKGGGNNFGIVSKFTLGTHPQGPIYYGVLKFAEKETKDVKKAILTFLEQSDKRATMKAYFRYDYVDTGEIKFGLLVDCYYDVDDKIPTPDPFEVFLAIKHTGKLRGDVTVYEGQIFTPPDSVSSDRSVRARWGCVMLGEYTAAILDTIDEQAKTVANKLPGNNGTMFTIGCKAFSKGMFDEISDDSEQNGAWPHKKGEANHPILVFAEWKGKENDEFWISEMKEVLKTLSAKISQNSRPVYSNTALAEYTKVEEVYRGNLDRLKSIRDKVDPAKVMSFAGGFKIPG
ncbi:hypothetical protein K443DRAFT_683637 [Laccaria amethystina LaAM-08-1]|uniref:FAD-binding PCMH-type domain-containing protein n=1 Tax=Laccaria amethystina LaAM-08-1 TaxID=1095629 RepID=A0A0C9XEK3_9AGAR|nr:hypothetical protein K443DRAFT_683637 [Laccaria amethystina LaAM-08-1]